MLFFRWKGRDPTTAEAFLEFVGSHLEQAGELEIPVLSGEDLHEAALAKKVTSGGLDGWGWNELKAFPFLVCRTC